MDADCCHPRQFPLITPFGPRARPTLFSLLGHCTANIAGGGLPMTTISLFFRSSFKTKFLTTHAFYLPIP